MVKCCVSGCKAEAVIKTRDPRIAEKTGRKGSSKLCVNHALQFHVHNLAPLVEYKVLDDCKDPFPDGAATKLYEHDMEKVNLVTTSRGTDILRCQRCGFEAEFRGFERSVPKSCLVPPPPPKIPFVFTPDHFTSEHLAKGEKVGQYDITEPVFLEGYCYTTTKLGFRQGGSVSSYITKEELLERLTSTDEWGSLPKDIGEIDKEHHLQDLAPDKYVVIIERIPIVTKFDQNDFELIEGIDPEGRARVPIQVFFRKSTGIYFANAWGDRVEASTMEELVEKVREVQRRG